MKKKSALSRGTEAGKGSKLMDILTPSAIRKLHAEEALEHSSSADAGLEEASGKEHDKKNTEEKQEKFSSKVRLTTASLVCIDKGVFAEEDLDRYLQIKQQAKENWEKIVRFCREKNYDCYPHVDIEVFINLALDNALCGVLHSWHDAAIFDTKVFFCIHEGHFAIKLTYRPNRGKNIVIFYRSGFESNDKGESTLVVILMECIIDQWFSIKMKLKKMFKYVPDFFTFDPGTPD